MQLRTLRCSPFSCILGAAWRNYALSMPTFIHARLNASTGEYLQASCRLLLTDNKRQDSHIIIYINILSDAPAKGSPHLVLLYPREGFHHLAVWVLAAGASARHLLSPRRCLL